jgi:hypothetical protein
MPNIDYEDAKTQRAIENLVIVACGASRILTDMGMAEEPMGDHAATCQAAALDMIGTQLFDATRFYFGDSDDEE